MYEAEELILIPSIEAKRQSRANPEELLFTRLFTSLKKKSKSYFITDINASQRREVFTKCLDGSNWIRFNPAVHSYENCTYDYVFVDRITSPEDVYDTLQKHVDKVIIFDSEKLLSHSNYLHLLNGAICSESDSKGNTIKLKVNYRGVHSFVFEGNCIILSGVSKAALVRKRHLRLLLRNAELI